MAGQPDISAVILKAKAAIEGTQQLRQQVEARWESDDRRYTHMLGQIEEVRQGLASFREEFTDFRDMEYYPFKNADLDMHEGHLRVNEEQKRGLYAIAKHGEAMAQREKVRGAWKVVFSDTKAALISMGVIAGSITAILVAWQNLR